MKTILKTTLISISAALLASQSAWANDINAKALELAGEKNFDQALWVLAAQNDELQQSYDHRFLEARILSWAGRYKEARSSFTSLMADYPDNVDVELAMGNLEYYQGNFDAAERQYQRVLDKAPQYTDARTGLANVQKAREAKRNDGSYRWRVDGGTGISGFDVDNVSDWNEQYLRAEYVAGDLAYSGSVNRYERFDLSDVQIGVGVADAVRGGFDWGLNASVTPDSDFRPDFSLGGRVGHDIKTEGSTVFYLGSSYRYDDYDAGGIHTIVPELSAYLENGAVLTGNVIGTFQSQEDDQFGWLIRGSLPVGDRLTAKAGFARAPEAVNGIAIMTESIFGGLSYQVRDDLELHLNLARDDREDVYVRESLNVGFTHKR